MRAFAELYRRLDETTSTNEKIAAMVDYFAASPPEDAAWAVYYLTGNRLKRLVNSRELRGLVQLDTGYPEWLIEETYRHVGDLAETITLLIDFTLDHDVTPLYHWLNDRLPSLRQMDEGQRANTILRWWKSLPSGERFVLNKLLTGAFRVGVSRRLVTRALAQLARLEPALIAHRLMGDWQPTPDHFEALIAAGDTGQLHVSQPYPFFLASPLESEPEALGAPDAFIVEWKWDGIRAQLIRRQGQTYVWSRGEDALNGRFPELEAMADDLPDGCVLDGEILAWLPTVEQPAPFSLLQRRIGRKKPGPKVLREAPVRLLAFDLLELQGRDLREQPIDQRRQALATLAAKLNSDALVVSDAVAAQSWDELETLRAQSRARGTEGFILKRRDSAYQVGRKRGDWWKWKIDPYTIDAVLIYAQPGSGRRANQLTDYTFAVRSGDNLVPIAKAYSGLDNEEITELDRWLRRNTIERFGPVRSVKAHHVFELAFEGINESSRHKSGIAVRFPRISRWRHDKSVQDIDTLAQVKALAGLS